MLVSFFVVCVLSEGGAYGDGSENDRVMMEGSEDANIDYEKYYRRHHGYSDEEEQDIDANGKPLCGKNAELVGKKCQCLPNYPEGNPRSSEGCYKCMRKCSKFAVCDFPGKCRCFYGYNGNGTYCVSEKATVKMISEVVDGMINISIGYESDSIVTSGFCKFGDITVTAKEANNDYFICSVPKRIPEHVPIQVSIDAETWSDDSLIFEKRSSDPEPKGEVSNIILVIIFVCVMLVIIVLFSNAKPVNRDETQPFIQQKRKPTNVRRRNPVP